MKIIIIGAGAAGLMCAAILKKENNIIVLEQNEKPGKKIYITGKGRGNLTNACERDVFFENIISNPKFLYSAFNTFSNTDAIDFFAEHGLRIEVERGMRAFPSSMHASDITKTLLIASKGVDIRLNSKVKQLIVEDSTVKGVKLSDNTNLYADKVIVATGGATYPLTGSTGDGYKFAKEVGHSITKIRPGLIGLKSQESICAKLSGLTLKNVNFDIISFNKKVYSNFGELLFTHQGLSGPIVLSASSIAGDKLTKDSIGIIDLKPKVSKDDLHRRIINLIEESPNKQIKTTLKNLLPTRLNEEIMIKSNIELDLRSSDLSKEKRTNYVENIKGLQIKIDGLCDIEQAIITRGGVNVKEINPKTFESKIVKGLYFIGEVIDVDGLTGGFNLQIAWSSAYSCAYNINEEILNDTSSY